MNRSAHQRGGYFRHSSCKFSRVGSCITISTRVSSIKNLLQNWPYRSSDRKLAWAMSEISRHLRFTKRERFPTRLLIKMMITSDKMCIFQKVFFMNMRHFHWKFAGLQLLALASPPSCAAYILRRQRSWAYATHPHINKIPNFQNLFCIGIVDNDVFSLNTCVF